jgi:hypothetical protein
MAPSAGHAQIPGDDAGASEAEVNAKADVASTAISHLVVFLANTESRVAGG